MAALPRITDQTHLEPAMSAILPEWQGVLNTLRVIALECRISAQVDLFKACGLLSDKREVAQGAHARALIKCLHQAINQKIIFYRPGSNEVSFDEAWVMQILAAKKRQDDDSFTFLIRSRIGRQYQRQIAFLINGISEQFIQD